MQEFDVALIGTDMQHTTSPTSPRPACSALPVRVARSPRPARVAATIGLAAGLVLAAAACTSESTMGPAEASTTTGATVAVADTSTTVSPSATAAPTTTVAASTTVAPTTLPPVSPTSAPAPAGGVVLGQPTNLQAATVPAVELPDDFVCDGVDPGIPGWTVDDCQQAPSYNAGLVTLVAHRNDDGSLAVFVLFHEEGAYRSTFEAYEPEPGTWSDVTVQVGDYHFDDGVEVWVGYRTAGTGGYLDIDVLDPRPEGPDYPAVRDFFLGGLQGLAKGAVDLHPGGATVLSADYAEADPTCCPSAFLVQEITFAGDQWRIDTGATYPAESAPTVVSDF